MWSSGCQIYYVVLRCSDLPRGDSLHSSLALQLNIVARMLFHVLVYSTSGDADASVVIVGFTMLLMWGKRV